MPRRSTPSTSRTPSEVAVEDGPTPVAWLVRHAQSVWNASGLVQGQATAPGLTARGRAEAAGLAERLAGSGAGLVLSSDLRRAVETARPIAQRLGVPQITDAALRERALGVAEGRPADLLGPGDSGHDGERVVDADARPAGGESLRELYERVAAWLSRLRDSPPAPVTVVVTHGGFLRVTRAWADRTPIESASWSWTPNAVAWRLDVRRGSISAAGTPGVPDASEGASD